MDTELSVVRLNAVLVVLPMVATPPGPGEPDRNPCRRPAYCKNLEVRGRQAYRSIAQPTHLRTRTAPDGVMGCMATTREHKHDAAGLAEYAEALAAMHRLPRTGTSCNGKIPGLSSTGAAVGAENDLEGCR